MPTYVLSRLLVTTVLVVCVAAALVYAEKPGGHKVMISADGIEGQPYTIEELGALVVNKDGELQVLFTMPGEQRVKVYRDVDIQEGDQIMMVNGKKAESIDDLKASLTILKVGDEIKLGIKRGKDMKILTFPKADPGDMPQMKRMMVTDDGSDGPRMTMRSGEAAEEVAILPGGGLIARHGQNGPAIGYLMPDAADILGDADIKEGDRVVSLQGESIDDLEQLKDAWDLIEIGDPVELVLARGSKEFTVKFVRAEGPKPGGMMMIKKE